MTDPSSDVQEALSNLAISHSAHEEFYTEVTVQITAKRYHQLTVGILKFTSDPSSNLYNDNFLTLFSKVLVPIQSKLNQLALSKIAWNVASSLQSAALGISLLSELISTLDAPKHRFAKLYSESRLHLLKLTNINDIANSISITQDSKRFLKENEGTLQELSSTSTESEVATVHSAYYKTAMQLYKTIGPAEEFYKMAIQYLHYTPIIEIGTKDEVQALARDLCLAALVGENVYNLGTVVYENSILLEALDGTSDSYLVTLMQAAANGDVSAIQTLQDHKSELEKLGCKEQIIREKIMLLALVNMVFQRGSDERTLLFDDVASRLEIDSDQVEWVVMKAFSLGLIKGSMDQVDGTVHVTWVMPRVLDDSMMTTLAERFGEWAQKVEETRDYMGEHIPAF
jgi:26S proteasome regulatory subunit N9